jgi:hypothetical protein
MINILDLSGLEGLISVALQEAAVVTSLVDPFIRKPSESSDGLFPKLSRTRKAYGLRVTGYGLRVTGYGLRVTGLRATGYGLVARH